MGGRCYTLTRACTYIKQSVPKFRCKDLHECASLGWCVAVVSHRNIQVAANNPTLHLSLLRSGLVHTLWTCTPMWMRLQGNRAQIRTPHGVFKLICFGNKSQEPDLLNLQLGIYIWGFFYLLMELPSKSIAVSSGLDRFVPKFHIKLCNAVMHIIYWVENNFTPAQQKVIITFEL